MAQVVKNQPAMQETQNTGVWSPSWEGGNGNPLQYSRLESPMDRGIWQTIVLEATKSQTRLSLHALYISCSRFPGYMVLFVVAMPLHTCPLGLEGISLPTSKFLGMLFIFVDSTQVPSFLVFIHWFLHMCIHLAFIYEPLGEQLLYSRKASGHHKIGVEPENYLPWTSCQ